MTGFVLALRVAASVGCGLTADETWIVVEAAYPGASATIVAETVAAPIEHQMIGIANRLRLESRSTDGRYLLSVAFKPGSDLMAGLTAIQECVNRAAPSLPEAVRKQGVSVKTRTPVRFVIALSAVDGAYDARFLAEYANLRIRDELTRVSGVGERRLIGDSRWRLRLHVDPDHLRARNLVPGDVMKAVQEHQLAGVITDVELPAQFEDVVVSTVQGQVVRLKDVARVELGHEVDGAFANLNSQPCVAIAISPTVDSNVAKLRVAIEKKLNELRPSLPVRTRLDLVFDGSSRDADERFLSLEFQTPEGFSREHLARRLHESGDLVRSVAGVKECLALSVSPFDLFGERPCLILGLAPSKEATQSREEIVKAVDAKLNGVPDSAYRWRGSKRNFDAAVCGPDSAKTRELADKLVERLRGSQTLSRVSINTSSSLRPHMRVEVDREKAKTMGASPEDVGRTVDAALGSTVVREVKTFGRTMPVILQIGELPEPGEAVNRLSVRNDKGQLVPLSALATVKMTAEPAAIDRIDMKFAVRVSGDATGDDPRKVIQALFADVHREMSMSDDYRLDWPQ